MSLTIRSHAETEALLFFMFVLMVVLVAALDTLALGVRLVLSLEVDKDEVTAGALWLGSPADLSAAFGLLFVKFGVGNDEDE